MSEIRPNSDDRPGNGQRAGEAVSVTLKLAQLGDPLAVEAGLWIDGQLRPVPVTLLIAAAPPKGVVATAPGHENCLIIGQALAAKLNLLFDLG